MAGGALRAFQNNKVCRRRRSSQNRRLAVVHEALGLPQVGAIPDRSYHPRSATTRLGIPALIKDCARRVLGLHAAVEDIKGVLTAKLVADDAGADAKAKAEAEAKAEAKRVRAVIARDAWLVD